MRDVVSKLVCEQTKLSKDEVSNLIEVPSDPVLGDYAFPCFILAKKLKKNPVQIAEEIATKLKEKRYKQIYNIEVKGAYVNFFIDRRYFAKQVFNFVLEESFGKSDFGKGKRVVIEFSQPNTHKAFHVGHIRGTCIGESLSRIHEFNGDKVIRLNYSGDTGLHIAKWIWGYTKFHSREKIKDDEKWIADIYVDSVRRLSKNKKFEKEVEEINRKLSLREDKKLNKIWDESRKLSIKSWNKIYKDLGTKFDKHYFESEMEVDAKIICEGLLKKGIASEDDAVFINLEEYCLGIWVLVRRDGTVLYSAKDIALAYQKIHDFKADEYLVLAGDEQRTHFRQLLKTLDLMKFPKKDFYDFLCYGMIRLPHGKMSSRTGDNVLYSDFIEEVISIAKRGIEKRGGKKTGINERAKKIALSAIKYSMLKQDPNKVIIFEKNRAVSFEGDTGPYLLYSYARACSILKKIRGLSKVKVGDLEVPYVSDFENELLKKVASFNDVVKRAYEQKAPNLIANYSFELCKLFNEFYHNMPVVGNEHEKFRAKIVESFKITLKKSCNLLGIEVMEEM